MFQLYLLCHSSLLTSEHYPFAPCGRRRSLVAGAVAEAAVVEGQLWCGIALMEQPGTELVTRDHQPEVSSGSGPGRKVGKESLWFVGYIDFSFKSEEEK